MRAWPPPPRALRARPLPPHLQAAAALLAAILLALTARAVPLHHTSDSTAPLLLLAHSGCDTQDPSLYSETQWKQYTSTQIPTLSRPYRLLNYEDTCGINRTTAVIRNALSILEAGGGVVSDGRPSTLVCNGIATAARALRRPQPAGCNDAHARSTVVVEIAKLLTWRSALLLSTQDNSECSAALLKVEHALAVAGLLVRYTTLASTISSFHPQVIIVCDMSIAVRKIALNLNQAEILLLKFSKTQELKTLHLNNMSETRTPFVNLQDEAQPRTELPELISNYFQYRNNLMKATMSIEDRAKESHKVNNPLQNMFPLKSPVNLNQIANKYETRNNAQVSRNNKDNPDRTLPYSRHKREQPKPNHMGGVDEPYIDLAPLELTLTDRIFMLRDDIFKTTSSTRDLYAELVKAASLYIKAESTRVDIFHSNFFLFKIDEINRTLKWRRMATFMTSSTRLLDKSEEWVTTVTIDAPGELELKLWGATQIMENPDDAKAVYSNQMVQLAIVLLCAACIMCATVAIGAAFVKRATNRHTPRRPRAVPVLAAADFQFPADERRRVGEGMETMISLLQQLHEFAGPEPERPDLLKRPEPLGQSVPSSTCSVTRLAPDNRTRYKGDPVQMKYLPAAALEPRRKTVDILLVMQSLRHENLNPFIGCLTEIRPALVFEACGRGSLEDVLVADDIQLDWTFRLSLLTDLVRGMRYLHASPVRVHARLSSRNCVVDSRWVLRITDYGLPAFASAQALPYPPRAARDLLWTAPEILRETSSSTVPGGTQPGDVYSFAIIMQEVIVRGEPYCMLSLTPEEILDKLSHPPPLIRPSVSMGAAPPEAVSVMRQCWSEQPDLRPDFNRLYEIFRHMHRGRKVNIVDSMFEMLEKYSNNLEELIKERTEELDMEKKKTEQLLNRMLPRTVAERLMMGLRVEPEEFEEVSIYFSDIVGFTSLAARSTPVQVVDLLNDLYTTFDAAIEQYRVYKVETIGDAYMVVGGLPIRCSDHAENIATMALHLLHLAGRFRIRHLPATPLHLRIGLHTGACCAGVVGLTMPRYCLFGDTVNTASRMESTGV